MTAYLDFSLFVCLLSVMRAVNSDIDSMHLYSRVLDIQDRGMYMDRRCGDTVDMSSLSVNTLKVSLTSNVSYDNDMNCSLMFSTDSLNKLQLKFDRFATEPGYDFLHVHDGASSSSPYISGMKGQMSGRMENHNVYTTSGMYLFLQFTSDSSTVDRGFTIIISTYFTGYRLEDAIEVSCGENGWDITVHMDKLRLIYPNAKASDIYLGDNTCTGTLTGDRLTFTQGLRECLTTEMKRDNTLVYHNELIYAEHDPMYHFIIRHYNWTAGVECDVNRNSSLTGHIHYDPIDHSKGPQITGGSHYTTNMSFYLDPNFVHGVPGNPLHLSVGEKLFVKVYTAGTDWTIKMRVHTCYTKPAVTSSDQMKFYLIKNGCEVDTNTHIISQSPHETKFTFEAFEYTSHHEGIQVYCDATFCGWDDYSKDCTQTCNPVIRRRRSIAKIPDPVEGLICEVDTNTHIISQSPQETKLTFEASEYASYHEGIQVYCDATFCGWDNYSKDCTQTCNPVIRKRRSIETILNSGDN